MQEKKAGQILRDEKGRQSWHLVNMAQVCFGGDCPNTPGGGSHPKSNEVRWVPDKGKDDPRAVFNQPGEVPKPPPRVGKGRYVKVTAKVWLRDTSIGGPGERASSSKKY